MSYIRLTTKRRQTGAGGQTSPPSCCATTAFPHVLITVADPTRHDRDDDATRLGGGHSDRRTRRGRSETRSDRP